MVEYEKVPLLASETSWTSSTRFEPCGLTAMKTLSGRVGIGVIVPLITYAWVPLREAPAAGVVNVIGPEDVAAMGNHSARATAKRAATRSLSFMVSP